MPEILLSFKASFKWLRKACRGSFSMSRSSARAIEPILSVLALIAHEEGFNLNWNEHHPRFDQRQFERSIVHNLITTDFELSKTISGFIYFIWTSIYNFWTPKNKSSWNDFPLPSSCFLDIRVINGQANLFWTAKKCEHQSRSND